MPGVAAYPQRVPETLQPQRVTTSVCGVVVSAPVRCSSASPGTPFWSKPSGSWLKLCGDGELVSLPTSTSMVVHPAHSHVQRKEPSALLVWHRAQMRDPAVVSVRPKKEHMAVH